MRIFKQKIFQSYFLRLFLSFFAVILLLLTMYLITDHYLKKAIHDQLTKNNEVNINNIVEKYEAEWNKIKHSTLSYLYNDDHFEDLYNKEFSFFQAQQLSKYTLEELPKYVSKYIENTIVWYKDEEFLIDQTGVVEKNLKFSHISASQFWNNQFEQPDIMQFYPYETFETFLNDQAIRSQESLPITIHNKRYPSVLVILLVDVQRMYDDFQSAEFDTHALYKEDLSPVFSQIPLEESGIDEFPADQNHLKIRDNYLFYERGQYTGLLYINQVPAALLTSTLNKLNLFSISMLVLSVVLSLVSSFIFSFKLYKPIQKLVRLASQAQHSTNKRTTNMHELDVISQHFLEIKAKNQNLARHMEEQTSLLETFYYKDRIKDIFTGKSTGIEDENSSYRFILFQVFFNEEFSQQFGPDQKNAVYFYSNFIQNYMKQIFMNHRTFQIESKVIVSIVFTEEDTLHLVNQLEDLKEILEVDQIYSYFTIAIGSKFEDITELNTAYEQTYEMLSLRSPSGETEFLAPGKVSPSTRAGPTHKQERELLNYLATYKFTDIRAWVKTIFHQLESHNASQIQYKQFCMDFTSYVQKSLNLSESDLLYSNEIVLAQKNMKTIEDFKEYVDLLIDRAENYIQANQEDHVIQFVQNFIKENYAGEISLQIVADHLNMSSSYLSAYIKEQTGMNFQDMLNNARIEKAKQLLHESKLPMQDISTHIGYFSTNSFYRMFKKSTGVTPGEYKRKHLSD